jgi:uncharacterized protein YgiM (DUF1202 family)
VSNKRFITVLIIIFVSLLIVVKPVFAIQFSDTRKHWAEENIKVLVDKRIISGYNDATFKPNNNITISEFISMVVKTLGIEHKSSSYKKNWYDDIINSALETRVIIDGEFDKYDRPIRRGEMAVIIVRALGLKPVSQKTAFKDDENIPQIIKGYIAEAANKKIIMGLSNGTFNANGNATRAEAATMIIKMLNYIEENSKNGNRKPVEHLIFKRDAIDAENIKYAKILTLGDIKEKGYFFSKCESNDREFITTNFSGTLAYIKHGKIIEKNDPLPMKETFCFPTNVEYDSFDYLGLYDYGEEIIELILNPFIDSKITFTIEEEEIEEEELKEPDVKPSPVYATIKSNTKYYSSNATYSKVIGSIPEGTEVEVIQDRSYKWYNIDYNGIKGWVTSDVLSIPKDPETNSVRLTKEYMEMFINNKGFSSNTKYFIWVDIDRQLVNIFQGSKGNWEHLKSIICATGKNESPTIRGIFTIQDRGKWFYNNRLKSGAMNWVRFNGSYLFHSVAMDSKQRITDSALGIRASAGCIRMSLEDSAWFYENVPTGTTVWVN